MIAFALVFGRFLRVLRMGVRDPEFRALLVAMVAVLAVGTIFYMVQEGWSFVDAIYFCVTTLTTVGFGDPAPSSDLSKVFTIFYMIVGLGLLGSFIAAVAAGSTEIASKRESRRRKP